MAAFTAAAAGGAALGWAAERRALGGRGVETDPAWAELREPVPARPVDVESFDGTRLRADVIGADDAPTLVLAHGYALSRHIWHYQRRDLADRYRIVSWDQRGHGDSDEAASGDYSIAALGRDLGAVLDRCVPADGKVAVAGHSLGGMTVLSWADQFPDEVERRLAGAVLLDTAGGDVLAGGVFSTGIAVLRTLENRVSERLWRTLGGGSRIVQRAYTTSTDLSSLLTQAVALSPDASPAHVAFVEQQVLGCPNSIKAALGPTLTAVDLLHAAKLLTVPTLVLVGERDRLTPRAQAEKLVDRLPDGRLVELPGVGHHPMIEDHHATTAIMRSFLDELPATRMGGS